jgi:hypothetical protein
MRTARVVSAILPVWMLALAPASHAQAPPSTPPAPATPTPPTAVPLIQTPPAVPPPTATAPAAPAAPAAAGAGVPVLERVLGHALSVEDSPSD